MRECEHFRKSIRQLGGDLLPNALLKPAGEVNLFSSPRQHQDNSFNPELKLALLLIIYQAQETQEKAGFKVEGTPETWKWTSGPDHHPGEEIT